MLPLQKALRSCVRSRARTFSIGASGDRVSQMACTPQETLAPSSWVTLSWSTGNQHEKPPSARGAVNPGYSNEKINAMVQHGRGHQADVQRGGVRKFNACHYGELSYQESQMCGQGQLGLEML